MWQAQNLDEQDTLPAFITAIVPGAMKSTEHAEAHEARRREAYVYANRVTARLEQDGETGDWLDDYWYHLFEKYMEAGQ